LSSDGGATNNDTNDYFGIELLYNTADAGLGNTALFDGNISAVKWKGAGADPGATGQRSYKFSYDKTDKLLSASFQKYGASSWNQEQNTLDEVMTYDHNGNILALQRKQNQRGLSGTTVTSTAQLVDNLTYSYANGNKLDKVVDTGNASGFKDAGGSTTDYAYDTHGNVTADQNKGISGIIYNVLGKVQQITFSDGRKVKYRYDASGNKLKMTSYATSTDSTVTDYVNSFVYVNGTISFFGAPEGRVMKNGSNYEYQYAIADHQGNTRVVFSSAAPAPDAPTATFEGDVNDKSSQYLSVDPLNVVSFTAANHTMPGNKVVRMNQNYSAGPAKSMKVFPGDAVDMEVYAYYESASGYGTSNISTSTLILNIASGLTGSMAAGPDKTALTNGINAGLGGFGLGGNQGDNVPAAYLNYILFDLSYNPIDAGWQPVTSASNFSKQKVSIPTKNIKEAGYIYVYLSYENQSNNYVYFDDFKVTQTKTNVIQYNEYYPFGLATNNSWTRDNNSNNFLYNAGSEVNTTSGFYDLPFRNYDASLGRFFQEDPLAHTDHTTSPFAYAGNNPVANNDPSGLTIDYSTSYENQDYRFMMEERARIHDMLAAFQGWSRDGGRGGGGNISAEGYSDSQLRSMYRSQGGSYENFGAWFAANVDGFGLGDRKIQGTDGKTYGADEYGRVGTYTRDEIGYYSYASTDGGKTWTKGGWTTDHVEVNFHPINGAQQGGLQQTPLTQDEVNALFRDSFRKDFIGLISATGGGSLPDASPASRDAVINKITRYSETMIYEKTGGQDRTLGIVSIEMYPQDALRNPLGPKTSIYTSPTFNPLAPTYYNPGQTAGDNSFGLVNVDGTQFRFVIQWQETKIN
jgi:RHS repeat-associated protein